MMNLQEISEQGQSLPLGWKEATQWSGRLEATSVDVWRIPLRNSSGRLRKWYRELPDPVQVKCDRYRQSVDRDRAVVGQWWRREIISSALQRPVTSLVFEYTKFEKPRVAMAAGESALNFNVSHSGDWVVLAAWRGGEVGVDVEQYRQFDYGDLAHRCFSPKEKTHWANLPDSQRGDAFYRLWTRKEAYVKAVGTGLDTDLQSFSVPLDDVPGILAIEQHSSTTTATDWGLWPLVVDANHAGALVTAGKPEAVRLWEVASDY